MCQVEEVRPISRGGSHSGLTTHYSGEDCKPHKVFFFFWGGGGLNILKYTSSRKQNKVRA